MPDKLFIAGGFGDDPTSGGAGPQSWSLTQAAFDRFLGSLDADRETAGRAYERIRSKLINYFDWRDCASPEEHADEAINRAARKLEEGDEIRDPATFVFGIARMMIYEIARAREKERTVLSLLPSVQPLVTDSEESDRRLDCLGPCLDTLTGRSRELILQYYRADGARDKIDRRRELARRLGLQMNALRIRACRVREKLEQCMNQCLAGR